MGHASLATKTTAFLRSPSPARTCTRRRAVKEAFPRATIGRSAPRLVLRGHSMSRAYQTPPTQNQEASLSAILASHLQQDQPQSMDGRQPEYPQSGLSSPYASYNEQQSEGSTADQASAVQYQPNQPDYKPQTFSSSATPNSEYGLPQSARSGSFPEYIQRSYTEGQQNRYSASAQGGHTAMAQTSSPSSTPNGQQSNGHVDHNAKSNGDVPIDPSIAQSSPTYPPHHSYSPYPPQQEMQQQYAGQPMAYGRPDWAGHYQQPMYAHSPATTGGAPPNMVAHAVPRPPTVGSYGFDPRSQVATDSVQGGHPLSTVYSFVPIPGAQQHKRPRRRYEEIERMYKCGWNGCEKAYGTLNHLNAHVTMQGHGQKRTPEGKNHIAIMSPSAAIKLCLKRGMRCRRTFASVRPGGLVRSLGRGR